VNTFSLVVMRALTLGVLLAIAGIAAAQQPYPSKPIRLVSPYPPGGGNDILSRLLAQKLSEGLGQQVIVDNRPGGNTIIGTEVTAKAPPDGYTILLAGSSHVLVPLLMKAPYDPIKDFAPVATLAGGELVLLANTSVPANNLQEFIALAKSKPGQLNYASYGTGTPSHLAGEFFCMKAGIKMQHIPYKGSAPALADLIGGQVQAFFSTIPSALPQVNSGKVKAVAVTGEKRLPALPAVPTFGEAGLPDFARIGGFYGIVAPAGTPKEIVDKLSAQIARILTLPDFKEKLAAQGVAPYSSTSEQFAALLKESFAANAKIIKAANIKLEQ